MKTPVDGFYAAYFTASTGVGLALLVLMNGRVTGADAAGVLFDGIYKLNAAQTSYDVDVVVKAVKV